jgi:hypothetical protein
MFTKIRNTMLALAAVASLGIASLATTTSADARGFGGGFSRGGGGGHIGMRIGGGRHIGGMRVGGMRHVGIRHIHRPHIRIGHRHPNWCRWHGRCHVHVRWQRPLIYGAGVVATSYAVAPAVAVAPRPCTCLTKEYTPDNLVVFKDVCTKEVASAPIGNTQVQLQLPQQQQEPIPQQQ